MWTYDYTQRTLSAKLCNLRDPVQTRTHTHMHTRAFARKHTHTHMHKDKSMACPFLPLSFFVRTQFHTHTHTATPTLSGLRCLYFPYSLKTSSSWQIIWDFGCWFTKPTVTTHSYPSHREGLEGHVSLWLARALSRLSGHFAVHQGLSAALVKWRRGTRCVPCSAVSMCFDIGWIKSC